MNKAKHYLNVLYLSTLNSYTQIFFSNNKWFGILLIAISFFDLYSGICGIISIITSNILALAWKYDLVKINKGLYSFNSLLVGLGIGMQFQFSSALIILVALSAILTLFIYVFLQGILNKYGLPVLSIPFLISFWILSIALQQFSNLNLSERGIYRINEVFTIGGINLVSLYESIAYFYPGKILWIYFSSLGAIFFQYNAIAGIIIALGLLFHSRIAFSLSILGFLSAFIFYKILGADMYQITYSYTGFNYILSAMAIGGFFLIPSLKSYFWAIILIPLTTILTLSFTTLLQVFGLGIYSLPFNLTVILFLYALKLRENLSKGLSEVVIQQYSPEKNLYSFKNFHQRFNINYNIDLKLPFFGKWSVSQGVNGEYTHQGEWKDAFDFVICDEQNKQYKDDGDYPTDYFCYKKAIAAPADGKVEKIVQNIHDNVIGQPNMKNNWGNTIIIKHNETLFSKYSHLHESSVKVKEGETVKQGQIIGNCGNSGRSPYPHLHFQLQQSPYIGSKTYPYPFNAYLEEKNGINKLKTYSFPKKDDVIFNIETSALLVNAFNFIPGKTIRFQYQLKNKNYECSWEVKTNVFNKSYLFCEKSNSYAYISNDGYFHYFDHFEGDKNSLLYYFFLAAYKILLGYYQNLEITDSMNIKSIFKNYLMVPHDFTAPFFEYMKASYTNKFTFIDNHVSPENISIHANINAYILKNNILSFIANININSKGIASFTFTNNQFLIEAICIED